MFDYAKSLTAVAKDIVDRCDALSHIDMSAVLIGCIKARKDTRRGLCARTVALRFRGGSRTTERYGYVYQVPKITHNGKEILYIISFVLPRFHKMSFEDKISTIFHELYHISPTFNGDIRRFKGSKYVHTSSQKKYDEHMLQLAQEYLADHPTPELFDFLKVDYDKLSYRNDGIHVTIYRTPKPEVVGKVSKTEKDSNRTGQK